MRSLRRGPRRAPAAVPWGLGGTWVGNRRAAAPAAHGEGGPCTALVGVDAGLTEPGARPWHPGGGSLLGSSVLAFVLATGLAHAGWTVTGDQDGCVYTRGEREASGATPVRVVCDWPVPAETLEDVLGRPGDHAAIFGSLAAAESLGRRGRKEWVRQVHKASGAPDREVVVVFETHKTPEGLRYTWRKADDQSKRAGVGVEPTLSEGYWQIVDKKGRTQLTYEVRYLAGGRVPAFLVRWFQGSGIRAVLHELRTFVDAREARRWRPSD